MFIVRYSLVQNKIVQTIWHFHLSFSCASVSCRAQFLL